MKNLSFLIQISNVKPWMLNLVILKWRTFEYKVKFRKRSLLFRSEIDIFDVFFKRMYKESFEDLQVNSN